MIPAGCVGSGGWRMALRDTEGWSIYRNGLFEAEIPARYSLSLLVELWELPVALDGVRVQVS